MLKITHTPAKHYENCFTITGNDIEELIAECLTRIRSKSREFYEKELRQNLTEKGEALIDIHAGQKNGYTVKLIK